MKVREAIEYIERDGWFQVAVVGDHRQYKHASKKGRVTILGKLSDDLLPKTARSIFKQAQIAWLKGAPIGGFGRRVKRYAIPFSCGL